MEEKNSARVREKDQINALRSGNRTAVLETLKALRTSGKVSLLPELFCLLVDQEDEEIINETSSLLNELKDQEASAYLAEAISNPEYAGIATLLVAACWQNGLSYGKYIDTFLETAIKGDYATAIEAFTVIEEAIGEVEQEKRIDLTATIKQALGSLDDEKKVLLRELVKVIESY